MLSQFGVDELHWPAQSPDLNPINVRSLDFTDLTCLRLNIWLTFPEELKTIVLEQDVKGHRSYL